MKLNRLILLLAMLFAALTSYARPTLVREGRAAGRIVVAEESATNLTAARLLRRFVTEATGVELPVVVGKTRRGDVLIGADDTADLTEDGYRLLTRGEVLRISSGGDKGTIYGVVALLERALDMTYYAADTYDLRRCTTLSLPAFDEAYNPPMRYRQTNGYGLHRDSVYRYFMRLEEPHDLFVDNLWVHTFNRLLPAAQYGEAHPEYFSYINGMRRPGRASQWCLTNPEVFEIVAARVDSIFKANPDARMISISQNDSNFTYCRCEECEKVNIEEGAPSGNYIRFLNKLAERFPDKEFSTLAYLFTMKPPKQVRPRENVNIMLCDIDCDREVPLTQNRSGREFVEALEGWSAISKNIFLWDYGINFDNMVSPFPNFHVIKPNIELFVRNHVTMHFSQIGGAFGEDFSEMRTWIVSQLMWNPDLDTNTLMKRFMAGYYGAAAEPLYRYEKTLEQELAASGHRLWIYDSPVSHKEGMLNDANRRRYNAMFDEAEAAVADDAELLRRVRLARLPLMYADLEIMRTTSGSRIDEMTAKLARFEQYVRDFGVPSLNERNNNPVDYCNLYRERFLPAAEPSKALGATVRWIIPPTEKYRNLGETALTDGLFGGSTFVESWVGWEGIDGGFVLDLGCEKEFTTVTADFLHQIGAWILLPRAVDFAVSSDDVTYTPIGRVGFAEDTSAPVRYVPATVTSAAPISARYIRVEVEGVKICPPWHYGVGCPCWFFIDEVTVK